MKHIKPRSKVAPVSASSSMIKGYADAWVCRKNPSKGKCKGVAKTSQK